uniref:exosortase n=1 Tax=Aquabacterium sp. TaxID=1872578 RepID=UPI0035B22786
AALAALPRRCAVGGTLAFGLPGLALYSLGRTQQIAPVELAALMLVLAAAVLCLKGWAGLRLAWFPLFLLFFVVPLPYSVTTLLTGPMKTAVSAVATGVLHGVGYPVGRSGVVITVGQYELLVAEACAGLQTMFTLEAMGLLYTHLMNYRSAVRNALMALLVVPLAFAANVIRVIVLVLVTYHLGDRVGQGFVHGAAGLLLFAVALGLISVVDRLLSRTLPARWAH